MLRKTNWLFFCLSKSFCLQVSFIYQSILSAYFDRLTHFPAKWAKNTDCCLKVISENVKYPCHNHNKNVLPANRQKIQVTTLSYHKFQIGFMVIPSQKEKKKEKRSNQALRKHRESKTGAELKTKSLVTINNAQTKSHLQTP